MSESTLQAKSVLIAGATGGIGSAIGREMHRRGAQLTLVARDAARLEDLEVPGVRFALDLRDPRACAAAVEAAVERVGVLDVVVNAVGVVAFGPIESTSFDAVEELFMANVFVPIALAQAALPVLRHGGALVNISGVIAERNLPGMAVYGASKAAVRALDEAMTREAAKRGIRVMDARPPHTETALASRPVEGTPPKLAPGLDPGFVAQKICDAMESGAVDLPSAEFEQR